MTEQRDTALDLAGAYAKIARGREGLQSLEIEISTFCGFQRQRMKFEHSLSYQYVLGDHEPVPIHYSIRIGEITYNLRSALDHVIWQLVRANDEEPDSRNAFPVTKCEGNYQEQTKHKLRGVDEDSQRLIRDFQPFSNGGVGAPLLMLNSICNIDKHRHLNLVATNSSTDLTQESPATTVDICFMDKELERNSPGYGSAIEREGICRSPVLPVLTSCLTAVHFVVDQLTGTAGNLIFGRPS